MAAGANAGRGAQVRGAERTSGCGERQRLSQRHRPRVPEGIVEKLQHAEAAGAAEGPRGGRRDACSGTQDGHTGEGEKVSRGESRWIGIGGAAFPSFISGQPDSGAAMGQHCRASQSRPSPIPSRSVQYSKAHRST